MKRRKTVVIPAVPKVLSSLGERLREHGVPVADEQPGATPLPPRTVVEPGTPELSRGAKVVVRRERKGHGGKTVTVIDGLGLSPVQLDAVARRMRKALGCGSWVDGGRVILQGDVEPAAEAWLRRHGAEWIVRGN
jgi:translation initiation factor 1 (eIF-1/SUI1)